jgi:hypothetical protein
VIDRSSSAPKSQGSHISAWSGGGRPDLGRSLERVPRLQ